MPHNTGRKLENLVQRIESHLVPDGFTVRMDERVFDDEGVQLAELDIIIEGPVGSSNVRWLIECRDRPSAGPAPVSWIEQLVGRKNRLNFDRVFAVSTTGFSPAAKSTAAGAGILLRTVTDITEIERDFRMREFAVVKEALVAVEYLHVVSPQLKGRGELTMLNPLCSVKGGAYQPLQDFLMNVIQAQQLRVVDRLPAQGPYRLRGTVDGRLQIQSQDQTIDVSALSYRVKMNRTSYEGKTLTAQQYGEGGRQIGQVGEFVVDFPTGAVHYTLYCLRAADGREQVIIEGVDKTPGQVTGAYLIAETLKR